MCSHLVWIDGYPHRCKLPTIVEVLYLDQNRIPKIWSMCAQHEAKGNNILLSAETLGQIEITNTRYLQVV